MPRQPKPDADPQGNDSDRLIFHYIKSNAFRVVHADGVYGGVSPKADAIQMAIFSERRPIPLQITHKISEDGTLGKEIERVGREGLVREVEVDLIMSIATARSVVEWLREKIKQAETIKPEVPE